MSTPQGHTPPEPAVNEQPGHLVPDPDDIYTDLDLLRERLLPLQNGERIAAREVGEWRLQIPDE